MDPFSLLTGTLTVLGACATVSRTLSRIYGLKSAPALIQALNNEMSDIQLALMDVNDYLRRPRTMRASIAGTDQLFFQRCSCAVGQIKDKVLEVDILLQYHILKPGKEESYSINRISFLREQDHLQQLQMDLRDARHQISGLFSRFGIRETLGIEQLVIDLHSTTLQASEEMRHGFSWLAQHQLRIGNIQTRIAEGQSKIESSQARLKEGQSRLREDQARIFENIGHLIEPLAFTAQSPRPSLLSRTQRPTSYGQQNIALSVARTSCSLPLHRCSCLRQAAFRDSKSRLGRLFVGYATTPIPEYHNRVRRCKPNVELILVYFFPFWFLHYMFLLHARYSRQEGLSFSFTVRQTLSDNHVIWNLMRLGDNDRMKAMLQSGQLSVNSQNLTGSSLLSVGYQLAGLLYH